jgi:hypothetical protein
MKLSKISGLASILTLFFYCHSAFGQNTDEKFFYRDTLFEFNGWKIEVTKSVAYRDVFKSVITVNNTSDQFLILDPTTILFDLPARSEKVQASGLRLVVIPPKYSKKFSLKFTGRDFRAPVISYEVAKMQITEQIESVYDLADINLNNESYKEVGGIQFQVVEKNYKQSEMRITPFGLAVDKDKSQDYKIMANVVYNGNKFLGIYFNNIVLKTKDGNSYINVGKRSGTFHYDKSKPTNKVVLVFPIEARNAGPANEPKLVLKEVFKEYSLATIVGFKVILSRGTEGDFNKKIEKGEDIEEME